MGFVLLLCYPIPFRQTHWTSGNLVDYFLAGVMLRCLPSRITLSAADLHEADSRIRARRAARIALLNEANLRLSPGPGRSIRHSTVAEKHHAGTLSLADHIKPSEGFCLAESHDCEDEAEAGRPSNPEVTSTEHALRFADSTLDGVVDVQPATRPSHCRNQSSKVDLAERIPDVDKLHGLNNLSSPPPGLPTRRHHGASQTFVVHDDPNELQDLIRHRHLDRLPSGEFHPDIPPPVPELVLPTSRVATNLPALDPGAPVFVSVGLFRTMVHAHISTGTSHPAWKYHLLLRRRSSCRLGELRPYQELVPPAPTNIFGAKCRAAQYQARKRHTAQSSGSE